MTYLNHRGSLGSVTRVRPDRDGTARDGCDDLHVARQAM